MTYTEKQQEHIECAFDAFCKVVVRHESINIFRELRRREAHEISLDYLRDEKGFDLSSSDSYFEQIENPTTFIVHGLEIVIDNERLASALMRLSEVYREQIFLYYFFRNTDSKVGALQGRSRSTSNYHRHNALKQLRLMMEVLQSEDE